MSELLFNVVFQDMSNMFKNQMFSAMYFGQHCGRNLLILKHELTVMIVFGNKLEWSTPELIKAVSFRGDRRKGIKIIGNGDIILLLDEHGCLWRLINGFEISSGENESFHSLKEECFYEWIPFRKFKFVKVLAVSAYERGFACLGVCGNSERKLVVLPSEDSTLEDYTFDELNTQGANLCSYYLTNFKIENSVFENALTPPTSETLLLTDRLSGNTYLCGKKGRNSVINVSSNILISALHFESEKCLLLCFHSVKLIFSFYNKSEREKVLYLSKKVIFVDKCCCLDTCLLWSDGISLNHTKLVFHCGEDGIKLSHLKLNCFVQSPLAILRMNQHVLTVTINNFYYYVSGGEKSGIEIRKHPQELLSEICKGANLTAELEGKTDFLAHYLQCKDIMQKDKTKGNTELKWEGNSLIIKSRLGIPLKEDHWKVRLASSAHNKTSVHVIDLEADLCKEALIVIENPFKDKCRVKASLVGDFQKKDLFLDLGVTDELESNFEKDNLNKKILTILRNRSKYRKGT